MSEMVDRVEAAIYEVAHATGRPVNWHDVAVSAIRAMRQPTQTMLEYGYHALVPPPSERRRGIAHDTLHDAWSTMIDAALKD